MSKYLVLPGLFLFALGAGAQELYVFTEPASNVAKGNLSARLTSMVMPMQMDNRSGIRIEPSVAWGISRQWMLKANLYASDMMSRGFRAEGAALYIKYRFLSNDDFHSHFRMAAYGKVALINNQFVYQTSELHTLPGGGQHLIKKSHYSNEILLEGGNSGAQLGLVATQLIHKWAFSTHSSYQERWNNLGKNTLPPALSQRSWQSGFSAGVLLLPRKYQHFGQTNLNLYAEVLTQKSLDMDGWFVDMAPAVQLMLKSVSRIDLGYRFQAGGSMQRFSQRQWLLRYEYNFFNAVGSRRKLRPS